MERKDIKTGDKVNSPFGQVTVVRFVTNEIMIARCDRIGRVRYVKTEDASPIK